MKFHPALVALAAAINAALYIGGALVLGVTAPGALAAVAAFSGFVTFLGLLCVHVAKKGE